MKSERLEIFPIPVYETVLDNGLTVIVAEIESEATICNLVVRGGSSLDGEHIGAAHFLEHLVIQGSAEGATHPLMRPLVLRGCGSNAGTSRVYTEYHTVGLSLLYKEMLDALVKIVFKAELDPLHLENQRSVILQEIRANLTEREESLRFNRDFFPSQANLHHTPAGNNEAVKQLSLNTLEQLYHRWYFPGNSVLIVVGGCEHQKIIDHISSICLSGSNNTPAPNETPSDPDPTHVCYPAKHKSSSINLIFPRPFGRTSDHLLIQIFHQMLFDSDVGLVTQKLRHEMGVVYSFHARLEGNSIRWTEVGTNCLPEIFDEVEAVFWEKIGDVRHLAIPEHNFNVVKAKAETLYALQNNNSVNYDIDFWIHRLISNWLAGEYIPIIPISVLSEATPENLARIANKYYRPEQAGLMILK